MFDFNRLLSALSARVGTTAQFKRMLEWKLLRGSHEFPGPDGGTCVNEAAVVAAGYPYRAIYRAKDLPASFSRPIAMFALCLNDTLGDELRQELMMPFVTRLAGSADASKIEMMRAELMLKRTVGEILAPALARSGYLEIAQRCRSLRTPTELVAIARCLRGCDASALHRPLTSALEHAADAGRHWLSGLPSEAISRIAENVQNTTSFGRPDSQCRPASAACSRADVSGRCSAEASRPRRQRAIATSSVGVRSD